ncbi:MAG: serine protease [Candidatus Pacebacteria bacterium]|nr:serine protease [Candidatus Paceibacterota bacterium]
MDIETLTKSQIVLLTLLVSFVTSIATGIVTVSLMDQAPPVIPQTINRVVERTVERVVPQEAQTATTVITQEKTVTVKETDLIAQAVARVRASVVRLHEYSEGVAGPFLSRAIVVADGYLVAQASGLTIGSLYGVPLGDQVATAKVLAIDGARNLALLEADTKILTPAAFGTSQVTLGQSVVAISGISGVKVASGIITALSEADDTYPPFEVNIDENALVPGAILANSDGAVLGMYTGKRTEIVPAGALMELMKLLSSNSGASATSTAGQGETNQ